MVDHFDTIPVACRTERLVRLLDLIMRIEADYIRDKSLKKLADARSGNTYDLEEIQKKDTSMKRKMSAFLRLNAMSMEVSRLEEAVNLLLHLT